MARKRGEIGNEENHERWLLTYADLITLLLAFFVVMYSMSQVDAKKFGKIAEALNGVLKGGESVVPSEAKELDAPKVNQSLLRAGSLKTIKNRVQERFKKLQREDEIQSEITERGLVIHILESALFKDGSATLEPKALEILDLISREIKPLPNHVRIEGHTDDRPIATSLYPSNWELSSARATEVVRYYTNDHALAPSRISALGYGEYRPLVPNNSIENRATNRRVDIVILTMELTLKEPSSQLYGSSDSQ
ncbi:MAG: flagellar motor protein MotB [candidate division Zixibacteria bacterium]|nr:flagellar motor protein MotB [candidate division Zixibacteria bacterium]